MREATTQEFAHHLGEFIKSFAPSSKVERYLFYLERPKRHADLRDLLWHASLLGRNFREWKSGSLIDQLRELGAGEECLVVSPAPEGRIHFAWYELGEGLGLFELEPGIASIVPGRLAYVSGEGPGERYICAPE
ncbi:MAG: hypothetical protein R3B07_08355 [Polyangiaceae bacterium]